MTQYDPNRFTYVPPTPSQQTPNLQQNLITPKQIQTLLTNNNQKNIPQNQQFRPPSFRATKQQTFPRNTFSKNEELETNNLFLIGQQNKMNLRRQDVRLNSEKVPKTVINFATQQIRGPPSQPSNQIYQVQGQNILASQAVPYQYRTNMMSIPQHIQTQNRPQTLVSSKLIPVPQYTQSVVSNNVKTYVQPQVQITRVIKEDPKVQTVNDNNSKLYYSKPVGFHNSPSSIVVPTAQPTCCKPWLLGLLGILALAGLITGIVLAANYSGGLGDKQSISSVTGSPYVEEYTVIKQETTFNTAIKASTVPTPKENQKTDNSINDPNKPPTIIQPKSVSPTLINVDNSVTPPNTNTNIIPSANAPTNSEGKIKTQATNGAITTNGSNIPPTSDKEANISSTSTANPSENKTPTSSTDPKLNNLNLDKPQLDQSIPKTNSHIIRTVQTLRLHRFKI